MPANVSAEFSAAERELAAARGLEEKIALLERLISLAPSHKSAENLRANLRSRLAKLRKLAQAQRKKARHLQTFKKTGDGLVCLIGFTNSGKSSLLAALTNAKPRISPLPFTTIEIEQGMLEYDGCYIQIVDIPALRGFQADSKNLGIVRAADLIVIVAISDTEINSALDELKQAKINVPALIVHNKADTIVRIPVQSKISVSSLTGQNINNLKEMIFSRLKIIRVYPKEPGKKPEKRPIVLKESSTIKDFAASIHKDFLKKFDHALVFGTSAKFQGQRCGLSHVLKDKDTVEIHLKK